MALNERALLIRSRAPLRISFAGGGTDIKEYYEKNGGAVISATISKYAYTTLHQRKDNSFRIRQESFGIDYSGSVQDKPKTSKQSAFFDAIMKHFSPKTGFDLITHSDVRYGSGLGASSTMMVSLVGAFNKLLNLDMDPYEIAETAYKIERQDLAIEGGKQDQYAAAFGGFNFMEFSKTGTVVNQMRLKKSTIYELQFRSILINTGATHISGQIIKKQKGRLSDNRVLEYYERLKQLAVEIKNRLYRDEIDEIGNLLNQEWENKKLLSEGISNKSIDTIFKIAKLNGAEGGKILGAGGGGYALLITNEEHRQRLLTAFSKKGYETSSIEFVPSGLETWTRNCN
jgi:D-glycero-alpha-D-manno-heptose-7-phosphate kinase